jgi:hypothetical protein
MSAPTNLRDVPLAPQSHLWSRSGFVLSILAFAVAGVIAVAKFPFADREHQLAIRADPTTPHLVVQSSHGMSGEPAPLGLEVQGLAEGAVVLIRGLVPGMELSTGSSVGGDAWQLSARDLHYAWIAPPEGFVGSADLIAELRMSNDKIADRKAIHLEWITPISPPSGERQLDREEITAAPPIPSEVAQPPIDPEGIRVVPSIPTEPAQRQVKSFAAPLRVDPRPPPAAPGAANCLASADEVRRLAPKAWPKWTYGPHSERCWYSGQKPVFQKEMPAQAEVILAPLSDASIDTPPQAGSDKTQSPPCLASAAEVRKLTPNAWPKWTYGSNGERCWYSGEKPVFAKAQAARPIGSK